jgi:site-specific DNA recombinase
MKTYYGYIRVSTTKQTLGVSLDEQKAAIIRFAEQHQLPISDWFVDVETAAKTGRPAFSTLIKQLAAGKARGVIIHKIDRSARNFRDWAHIGELADQGVAIHFVTESLDFQSRGGRLAADIQAVVAADYIRNLREETIKGITGRLKQGLYPFSAPIGYLNNGGGQVKTPDPMTAPYVVEAFHRYATGQYSLRSLQRALTQLGFSRTISLNSLTRLLTNPFYHGTIKILRTGQEYPGRHQPLISRSLFDDVQTVRQRKTHKAQTIHNHPYRQLFTCTLCGKTLIPERQKAFVYYRCHTKVCPATAVREDVLEDAIARELQSVTITTDEAAAIHQELLGWLSRPALLKDSLSALRLQLASVERRIEHTTDALIDGHIGTQEHGDRLALLNVQRENLGNIITRQERSRLLATELEQRIHEVLNVAVLFGAMGRAEKRELIRLLCQAGHACRQTVQLTLKKPDNFVERYGFLVKGYLQIRMEES